MGSFVLESVAFILLWLPVVVVFKTGSTMIGIVCLILAFLGSIPVFIHLVEKLTKKRGPEIKW